MEEVYKITRDDILNVMLQENINIKLNDKVWNILETRISESIDWYNIILSVLNSVAENELC